MVIAPKSSEQMNNRPILSPGSSHSLLKYSASVCPNQRPHLFLWIMDCFLLEQSQRLRVHFSFFFLAFHLHENKQKNVKKSRKLLN